MKTVLIHGAPRSGTSWLGQIFNSNPKVAFRFQPLFSYKLKNFLSASSTKEDVHEFLSVLENIDDDFILQKDQQARGAHPTFDKDCIELMAIKHVRYHFLVEKFLKSKDDLKVIAIVRNPCGSINSWLKTSREFNSNWNAKTEWRSALSKNMGKPEEYYGFDKWLESSRYFIDLESKYQDRFIIVQYESLVSNTLHEVKRLFSFCDLKLDQQTLEFIKKSHSKEIDDPDTVFRKSDVSKRWIKELDTDIISEILETVRGTELERFLC